MPPWTEILINQRVHTPHAASQTNYHIGLLLLPAVINWQPRKIRATLPYAVSVPTFITEYSGPFSLEPERLGVERTMATAYFRARFFFRPQGNCPTDIGVRTFSWVGRDVTGIKLVPGNFVVLSALYDREKVT